MILLVFYAFLAGIVTILSPCILPLLPILLASTTGRHSKAFGVLFGFVTSFVFLMLIVSYWAQTSSVSVDTLRIVSIGVLVIFGLTLLFDGLQDIFARIIAPFTRLFPLVYNPSGFIGGLFIGASLGIVWSPCIGPIISTVMSLAMMGKVTTSTIFITAAYAVGTALPMVLIILGGRKLLYHKKTLISLGIVRKLFGVLMLLTAFVIAFQIDRQIQSVILDTYPKYAETITDIESTESVNRELEKLKR